MVDRLTALVYQRCLGSLYEEHRLLFATLLCLNMQEEGHNFTEEELSLLLQGMDCCLYVINMFYDNFISYINSTHDKVRMGIRTLRKKNSHYCYDVWTTIASKRMCIKNNCTDYIMYQ